MPKIVEDEQVFQGVIQVMLAHGYDGATTKQMAEAADVGELTLFRRYRSKAELVKLAILAIAQRIDFESVVEESGDVYHDLVNVVRRYQNLVAEYGEFLAVLIPEMQRHPELAGALGRPMRVMRDIGRLLVRYQEAGVLRSEPALHGVAALLGPLAYFAMLRGTAFEEQIPAIEAEQHVRRFLDGRRNGAATLR